jgi:hypothetical protein
MACEGDVINGQRAKRQAGRVRYRSRPSKIYLQTASKHRRSRMNNVLKVAEIDRIYKGYSCSLEKKSEGQKTEEAAKSEELIEGR